MDGKHVDFHCHLDLYPDYELAVRRAEANKVFTLSVTTTPKAWPRNLEVTKGTRFVRAALGLHPQLVGERANEISTWEKYLPETRYIGEIGLDAGPRFYKTLPAQKEIFDHILRACSSAGNKVLSIHSVRAATAVLDAIESNFPQGRGTTVLHWFTGTKSETLRAVELGCYFSVNAEMLKKETGRRIISAIPTDRILTETDGPFAIVDGRAAEPHDVAALVGELGSFLEISKEVLTRTILSNLEHILREAT